MRTPKHMHCQTSEGSVPAFATAEALKDWLVQKADPDETWLLAHAEDGVVWGRLQAKPVVAPGQEGDVASKEQTLVSIENGAVAAGVPSRELVTSERRFDDKAPGSLHPRLFQQCRLFGHNSELRLWRNGTEWRWQRRTDAKQGPEQPSLCLDEAYILWGDHVDRSEEGFALLSDGAQGLRHAVPQTDKLPARGPIPGRPLRLHVRHYLAQNQEDGTVYIAGSRLVDLTVEVL